MCLNCGAESALLTLKPDFIFNIIYQLIYSLPQLLTYEIKSEAYPVICHVSQHKRVGILIYKLLHSCEETRAPGSNSDVGQI